MIANAQAMQQVQLEYGSFPMYLQAVKAQGEEALLKDLRKRFAFLGETTSIMFLFGVGDARIHSLTRIALLECSTPYVELLPCRWAPGAIPNCRMNALLQSTSES